MKNKVYVAQIFSLRKFNFKILLKWKEVVLLRLSLRVNYYLIQTTLMIFVIE